MESKIIDMLLEIKSDVGDLKRGQTEIKYSLGSLDGRVCRLEDDMADVKSDVANMKIDIAEIKTTVNALSEGLLTTSKEVKEQKAQRYPQS
jgi:predicted  nucleic acid-binding Zn-ribbon protein